MNDTILDILETLERLEVFSQAPEWPTLATTSLDDLVRIKAKAKEVLSLQAAETFHAKYGKRRPS